MHFECSWFASVFCPPRANTEKSLPFHPVTHAQVTSTRWAISAPSMECRTGKSVEIEARRGNDARLHARIDEPVRGGAEELSAREVMIDGLVEIIERGERPDDDVVVPRLEIVAADDADAERIATVGKSIGDHVGRCEAFGGPNTAPI